MMKKTLSILVLSTLPAFVFAAGGHSGDHHAPAHGMPDHDMSTMSQAASFYGQPGELEHVSRTIEVTMDDAMRFTPNHIKVTAGETVRFAITNSGKIPHEMVIGSLAELKAHADEMLEMPDMQHSDPNMITLDAGQRGELIWQFDKATEVDFACLIPGHTEAGMVGKINVE
ncbi:MAG TPA: cupredoxin family protein [Thiopseudomonas sp.]|nr:cupredoxin family protein [Thiopseudomonas sp.]